MNKDTPQSNYTYPNNEAPTLTGNEGCSPQSNTDWREEFDRRWPSFSVEGDHSQYSEGFYAPDRENLADFISQLLEAEKKRLVEKVEEVPFFDGGGQYEIGYDTALRAVLQKLS